MKNVKWILIFLALLLAPFVFFHSQNNFGLLQAFTVKASYWLALFLFTALIAVLIAHRRDIAKIFPGRKTVILLALIVILSVYLRAELSPMYHPFRTGGGEYKLTAKYLSLDQQYSSCLTGTFDNCDRISTPEHGVIYSFMISSIYTVFGFESSLVTWFNIILSCITVVLVFLTAQLLFSNSRLSLFSALIFSLLERHIIFSGTDEITVAIAMLIALFFFSLALLWKNKSAKTLVLTLVVLSLAINTFVINAVLIAVLLAYLLFEQDIRISRRFGVALIILFLTALPMIFFTLNNPFTMIYNDSGNTMFNIKNLPGEIITFFSVNLYAFPIVLLAFFVLGLFSWNKYRFELQLLFFSIVIFVGTHLVIFHQNYERYLVHYYPLLAIIMGAGAHYTYFLLANHKKPGKVPIGLLLVLLILLTSINFNNLFFEKNKLHLNDGAYQAKDFDDSAKLLEAIEDIPSDACLLLTSNNINRIIMAETNRCVISNSEFSTNPYKWNQFVQEKEVYLVDDAIFTNYHTTGFVEYMKSSYILKEVKDTRHRELTHFWKVGLLK